MSILPAFCAYDQLTLERLATSELLAKQSKNRRAGYVLLFVLVLIVSMAFMLESYLVAVASWALVPALTDYRRRDRAISDQLRNRNIG